MNTESVTGIQTAIIEGSDAANGRSVWAVAWHPLLQPCCPTSGQTGGEPRWWDGGIYAGAQCSTCGGTVTPYLVTEEVTGLEHMHDEALERVERRVSEDVFQGAIVSRLALREELADRLLYAAVAAAEIAELVPPPADWFKDHYDTPDLWLHWIYDHQVEFNEGATERIVLSDGTLSISVVDPVSLAICPDSPSFITASVQFGYTDVTVTIS